MKNSIRVTAVFLFCTALASCSKTTEEKLPSEPVPINLTSEQAALVTSQNSFAFDLFRKVYDSSDEQQNIIISPLSVAYALSMTLNGANGETRDAMLEALRMNGISPEEINGSYSDLTKALLSVDERVQIKIANSVWTEKNFVVKKEFPKILTDFYDAEAKSFDVTDPNAPDQINAWIDENTNGLIKNMLQELNDNTVMLLVNAIYFKGKWKSEYDKSKTVQSSFSKPDGTAADVPMMKQKSDFKVFADDNFILAEFPYGQGNFVMDVILPSGNRSINMLSEQLTGESFNGWLAALNEREVDVSFPRFKYGFKENLNDILTDMGMGIAFTDNADFSHISDLPLLINQVLHQAFIETNEEGTEAAAATIVDIGNTSMPPEPLVFNADHPFIYIIRETTTNSVIFMGKVADPMAD